MILEEIHFSTLPISNWDGWKSENILFKQLNLIVGKNAVGKSRLVMLIRHFAQMLTFEGREPLPGKWQLVFKKDDGYIKYDLYSDKSHCEEKIYENDKLVLDRKDNSARIFSYIKKDFQEIKPPSNVLVLHARRDIEEYPFLEDLIHWALQLWGFKFSSTDPSQRLPYKRDGLTDFDSTPFLLRDVQERNESKFDEYIEQALNEFNTLGYQIKKIVFKKSDYDEINDIIEIQENDFTHTYPHYMLSQGMFRSLSLVLYVNYLLLQSKVSTILIDDLGEGLDYERATKLGKWLISKLEGTNIQLIATSNDSFLMDVIDIKYWNVLYREKNVIRSYNYQNSKEKFDSFRFTGLSNFDFFSSDYLLSK